MMKRNARERGQDLVEFAIILPILMLILMVILDLGRAVYYYSSMMNSTREGARYGIVHFEPEDVADIEAVVRSKAVGLNPLALIVDITLDDETIKVIATYDFHPVTPLVGALLNSDTVTLRTSSTMRTEG
jgi:Flp pilus assembly protein TadG